MTGLERQYMPTDVALDWADDVADALRTGRISVAHANDVAADLAAIGHLRLAAALRAEVYRRVRVLRSRGFTGRALGGVR